MSDQNFAHVLSSTVEQLSDPKSLEGLFHQHRDGSPLPSGKALEEIIELSRAILFPGYYGKSSIDIKTIRYHIGVNLERLHKLLSDQILAGLCFCITCDEDSFETLSTLRKQAEITATNEEFLQQMCRPHIMVTRQQRAPRKSYHAILLSRL